MKKIGVLISGRGSNLQALIDAQRRGELGGEIAIVISNVESAPGLERARRAGIPAVFRDHRGKSREAFDADLVAEMREHGVELVCLAGFMRLLSPTLVRAFRGRILNVHPALLPRFGGAGMYGERVHRAVLDAGERVSGVTVHVVDEEYDHGPIVAQREVPVEPGDTPATLAARILKEEHALLPTVVRAAAEGRLHVEGGRAWIEEP